jgi:hypothetical protein
MALCTATFHQLPRRRPSCRYQPPVSSERELRARLSALARLRPAERSQAFEGLLADVFKRAQFRIERASGAARPRQLDLAASRRGGPVYLVEAKWKTRALDVGDVDGLYARLEGTPPTTTGVLIGPSGFSSGLKDEVVRRKSRPVLLVGGQELLAAVDDPRTLAPMLQRKLEHFQLTGDVLLDDERVDLAADASSRWRIRQPILVDREGVLMPWVASGGGYGQFAFALELADIDWVPSGGRGVSLDLGPQVESQAELVALVEELVDGGWLTAGATWVFEQADTNWHGFGWSTFIEAVSRWEERYQDAERLHHTEQFCLVDSLGGHLLVVSGDLSAREDRSCRRVGISFHVQGVPLDSEPFTQLAESIGEEGVVYWRPLDGRSVHTIGLRHEPYDAIELAPVAYVVEHDPEDADPFWVRGIVVANPFNDAPERVVDPLKWPAGIGESQFVICSLGQWHPWSDTPERYELRFVEWANTTDFSVVRVVGDWRGELVRADRTAHPHL